MFHSSSRQLAPARASSRQLNVEPCASPSDNLISLRYLMLVFSANLLGLFCILAEFDHSFVHYKQQQNWTEQWYYECYIRGTLWVHKPSNFITAYVHFFGQGCIQWSKTVMGFFCEPKRGQIGIKETDLALSKINDQKEQYKLNNLVSFYCYM